VNDVFADTFYFLSLLGPTDESHHKAIAATVGRTGRLVTTAWVVTELANALHRTSDRPAFLNTFAALRADDGVVLVPPDQALFDAGVDLYSHRSDKEWSLTDCISFVVMRERGIDEALTGDHHFEQAGFVALLR